jgi:four helix bundle protein
MRDFKRLTVWQKAHRLALDVYRLTSGFPREERFGLTAQLRKSAASVPTNIAEGCGRSGEREFAHFVSIASGSASETEYHLLLAHDLGYLSAHQHQVADANVNEVKKMLGALHRKLTANS